jgi:hypothetical protein
LHIPEYSRGYKFSGIPFSVAYLDVRCMKLSYKFLESPEILVSVDEGMLYVPDKFHDRTRLPLREIKSTEVDQRK